MSMRNRLIINFYCLIVMTSGAWAQNMMMVRPVEIDEVLINPGMGFTTFQMFNGDNLDSNIDVFVRR